MTERLKVVEAFRNSGNRPEWLVLNTIPVIPPDLRPLVMLESETFKTNDLNDLYRRVLNRSNRLKKLPRNTPEFILRNEREMIQRSVDALFDNEHRKQPVLNDKSQNLESLNHQITKSEGHFHDIPKGKYVDFSAETTLVVDPNLRLDQCGLPKNIASVIYKVFLVRRLKERRLALTLLRANMLIMSGASEAEEELFDVVQNHPVMLSHPTTPNRTGIMAFEPILVDGKAIRVHPLVYKAFHANAEDDSISVHLPLSLEARVEAYTLLLATNHLFSTANSELVFSPLPEIVSACRFVTKDAVGTKGAGTRFATGEALLYAARENIVDLHAKVQVRMPKNRWLENAPNIKEGTLFETTAGRMRFNALLPEGMPYYNQQIETADLDTIICTCYKLVGHRAAVEFLHDLSRFGLEETTKTGSCFVEDDAAAEKGTDKANETYSHRGSTILGYFNAAKTVRRDLYDASRLVCDPAKLTREIVGATHNVIITQHDCCSTRGITITTDYRNAEPNKSFHESITGRVSTAGLFDPKTKKLIVRGGELITNGIAQVIQSVGYSNIKVRSPLTCEAERGVCALCYGADVSTNQLVEKGMAVGIIAGQALGEGVVNLPRSGTSRLREMLRAEKSDNVAIISEIDGKVRFRARWHGKKAILVHGKSPGVQYGYPFPHGRRVRVRDGDRVQAGDVLTDGPLDPQEMLQIYGVEAVRDHLVREIQDVYRSHDVRIDGKHIEIVVLQMLSKVRIENGGESQLIEGTIADKSELKRRNKELTRFVKIVDPGDVDRFHEGDVVSMDEYKKRNDECLARGEITATGRCLLPARGSTQLFGIVQIAQQDASFISVASAHDTKKAIVEAAIAGKVDPLVGLRENTVIGRIIPAGTGFETYRSARWKTTPETLEWLVRQEERERIAALVPNSKANPWVHGKPKFEEDISLVPFDPLWFEDYRYLGFEIHQALDQEELGIHHVGSTSVAGLAAHPVIDIVLIVEDPIDEAVYVPALKKLGYDLTIREPDWYEHRCLQLESPRVDLHVFGRDCPEVTRYIWFRDHLRNHDKYCDEYQKAKYASALDSRTVAEYNEKKNAAAREIYENALKKKRKSNSS